MHRFSPILLRRAALLACLSLTLAPAASAVPPQAGAADDEIIDFVESDSNTDYESKTDSEGSEWEYDPGSVELTAGESDTGTNFQGARILEGNVDVVLEGGPWVGDSGDEQSTRYANWQGSTLFFGAQHHETGNKVDAIAEFYWFESSIPRGSDFYVMQIKVKSSPDTWEDWGVADEANFWSDLQFWNDINPAQSLSVAMEDGGQHGSLRWDWCVPFDTYEYEPLKVMQLQESYGAGYTLDGSLNGDGTAKTQFKEGGLVADLSGEANIQSKGYINSDFKVQSQYTVTLYRWQMLVQSGGQEIRYKTVVLPNEIDAESAKDSAYHEYFIVMQATRGVPVHIENIDVGASFREFKTWWFDDYQDVSVAIGDLYITPPPGICLPGDLPPAGTCKPEGVCGQAKPKCSNNIWLCPIVASFEEEEATCDGLDNDCDGLTDENLEQVCETACGTGYELCKSGEWGFCSAPAPMAEACGNLVDDDCNGLIDDGCDEPDDTGDEPDEPDKPVDDPDDTGDEPDEPIDDPDDGSTDGATDAPDDVPDYGGAGGGDSDPFAGGDNPSDAYADPSDDGGANAGGGGDAGCTGGGSGTPAWPLALLVLALVPVLLRRRRPAGAMSP